jgi:hypothetical protein
VRHHTSNLEAYFIYGQLVDGNTSLIPTMSKDGMVTSYTCGHWGCLEVIRMPKHQEEHIQLHVQNKKKEQEQAPCHHVKEEQKRKLK